MQLNKDAVCIGLLAEPFGFNIFNEIMEIPGNFISPKAEVRITENAIHIKESGYSDLYLFPGRQIVTKERIEILCLLSDLKIENGLAARQVIDIIRQNNGIPVLSWAPGKWFFKRGKLVESLINSNKPGSILLGDTALRPTIWGQPLLIKRAVRKGFTVICGSDPLPFSGEENVMGRYAISFECDFDANDPTGSIRNYLLNAAPKPVIVGKRGGIFSTIYRIFMHARTKNRISKK